MKKGPVQNSNGSPQQGNNTTTSSKGRRAVTSLWYAIRTINGALLTDDDLALVHEALAEISAVLQ